jgi:N-acetylglucosamine-6-phosphate deacetylase
MRPLTHRAPGIAAVALADARLSLGLVADGDHVDPLVLDVVRAAAGDRVVVVSDASPAADAPAPLARFAGVVLDPDGRIAGRPAGGLRLLDHNARVWGDLAAATTRPAALLGLPAPLSPGAPADLVEWAPDGTVARVMRGGTWR